MEHSEQIVENEAIEVVSKEKVKPALQRKTDKYVTYARELSSRGSSFWIATLGVILQAAHTSLLLYGTSAFKSEWQKIVVSLGLGLFLSASLMIFTLKHKTGNKKSEFTLNLFFWFEVFIGTFYYLNKLIFSVHKETGEWPGLDNYVFLLVGLPFAYMAPYAIKQFAYVIESDKSLEFGEIDKIPEEHIETDVHGFDLNEVYAVIDEKLNEKFDEFLQSKPASDSVDSSTFDAKLEKLTASTKTILKEFERRISEIPVVDESKFIKKGETIKMKTGDDVRSIQLSVPDEKAN